MNAAEFYNNRIVNLNIDLKKIQSKKSIFGVSRFGTILAILASFYFLWNFNKLLVLIVTVLLLIIFIQLIYKDLANRAAIKNLQHLIKINEDELLALDGNYYHFEAGEKFKPHTHFYANDMDVFGRASL